ncbi:MAG: aminopeptidase P N-terminal domain-containing protein [Myxococcota bacterium]|nr:aminopeptidase P N-terminal domain-containing protein [Myxococcota bacterium]
MLSSKIFAARRQAVLDRMQVGQAMLLMGAHHPLRNGDAEYRFRQHSDLIYLSGWSDPEAALLLVKGAEERFVLFIQPKDPEREVWTGRRAGTEGALADFGADAAFDIAKLKAELGKRLIGVRELFYAAGHDAGHDTLVMGALAAVRRKARDAGDVLPDAFIHPGRILHELRLHKSEEEVATLRRAGEITTEAHHAAMAAATKGMPEYELEALVDYTFRRRGGNGPGYTTIVGAGDNANILHYIEGRDPMGADDLVLIDAGCELDFYTADVTRTFPVSGRFTPAQKEVYSVVLEAQYAAIEACRVGNTFNDVHQTAVRVLTQGMLDLGLLEGKLERLIQDKSYKRYYMHGTSHWLGMDVHDVGSYVADGGSRPLEPGMVLTVEPGLYIPADDEQAPRRLRGIGVRIEDDILVTSAGPDNLTEGCVKEIPDVERVCQGG